MNSFQLIASDYRKYKEYGGSFFGIIFFTQSFWAMFQYRIANGVFNTIRFPVLIQMFLFLIWQKGVPVIGNNVYIDANAVVVGNIVLSSNVLITAFSIVNSSISENSIMCRVSAQRISEKSSKGYI